MVDQSRPQSREQIRQILDELVKAELAKLGWRKQHSVTLRSDYYSDPLYREAAQELATLWATLYEDAIWSSHFSDSPLLPSSEKMESLIERWVDKIYSSQNQGGVTSFKEYQGTQEDASSWKTWAKWGAILLPIIMGIVRPDTYGAGFPVSLILAVPIFALEGALIGVILFVLVRFFRLLLRALKP